MPHGGPDCRGHAHSTPQATDTAGGTTRMRRGTCNARVPNQRSLTQSAHAYPNQRTRTQSLDVRQVVECLARCRIPSSWPVHSAGLPVVTLSSELQGKCPARQMSLWIGIRHLLHCVSLLPVCCLRNSFPDSRRRRRHRTSVGSPTGSDPIIGVAAGSPPDLSPHTVLPPTEIITDAEVSFLRRPVRSGLLFG